MIAAQNMMPPPPCCRFARMGLVVDTSAKQHRGVHKDTPHQSQNTNSLRDTGDDTTLMVFECKHAVKLYTKYIEVGTDANINPRQDQVIMRRVTGPRSTNQLSLSFVRIQYHAPLIAPLLNPSHEETPLPVACRRNGWVVLFFGVFPSDLCYTGMGKIQDVEITLRLGVTGGLANYSPIITIKSLQFIQFMITLLY